MVKLLKINRVRGVGHSLRSNKDFRGFDRGEWIVHDRNWIGRRSSEIAQLLPFAVDSPPNSTVDSKGYCNYSPAGIRKLKCV